VRALVVGWRVGVRFTVGERIAPEEEPRPVGPRVTPRLGARPEGVLTVPRLGARLEGDPTVPRLGVRPEGVPTVPRLGARPEGVPTVPRLGARPEGVLTVPRLGARPEGVPTVPRPGARAEGEVGRAAAEPRLFPGGATRLEGRPPLAGPAAVGREVGLRTAGAELRLPAPGRVKRSEGLALAGVRAPRFPGVAVGLPGRTPRVPGVATGSEARVPLGLGTATGSVGRAPLAPGFATPGRAAPLRDVPGWATAPRPDRGVGDAGAFDAPTLGWARGLAATARRGDSLNVVEVYPLGVATRITPRAG
jgi:hypothetical protein